MQHLLGQLEDDSFIQLHRSCVVRCDCVDRVVHRTRSWVARLKDGTEQRVSKSRVAQVMQRLGLTNPKALPSTTERVIERARGLDELRMTSVER
jgi:hypothetical protein